MSHCKSADASAAACSVHRWLAKGASRWDEDLPGGHAVEVQATSAASQPQSVATPAHTAVSGRPKEPFAFSTGPRDCIGQTLARMELQVGNPKVWGSKMP